MLPLFSAQAMTCSWNLLAESPPTLEKSRQYPQTRPREQCWRMHLLIVFWLDEMVRQSMMGHGTTRWIFPPGTRTWVWRIQASPTSSIPGMCLELPGSATTWTNAFLLTVSRVFPDMTEEILDKGKTPGHFLVTLGASAPWQWSAGSLQAGR